MAETFVPLSLDLALRQSASYASHARSCKKAIDSCKPCKLAIAWYAGLPLPLLADVLADRSKPHKA
jgi:hypothetical protein